MAAGDLDEFLDPADSGNQRVVPFFEKHPRQRGKRAADSECDRGRTPSVRKHLGRS
jgi:hypothetical protein